MFDVKPGKFIPPIRVPRVLMIMMISCRSPRWQLSKKLHGWEAIKFALFYLVFITVVHVVLAMISETHISIWCIAIPSSSSSSALQPCSKLAPPSSIIPYFSNYSPSFNPSLLRSSPNLFRSLNFGCPLFIHTSDLHSIILLECSPTAINCWCPIFKQ